MYSTTRIFADPSELRVQDLQANENLWNLPGVPVFLCEDKDEYLHEFDFDHLPVHVFVIGGARITAAPMFSNKSSSITKCYHGVIGLSYGLGLVKDIPTQIVVANATDEASLACVDAIVEMLQQDDGGTGCMQVVYDDTGRYDAVIPADAFVQAYRLPVQYDKARYGAVYVGSRDKCSERDLNAYENIIAFGGGGQLRRSLPGIIGTSTEAEMKNVFNCLYLGKDEMMDLYPADESARFDASIDRTKELSQLNLVWTGTLCPTVLPVGAFRQHAINLYENAQKAENATKIWQYAFRGTFFTLNDDDRIRHDLDLEQVKIVGEALGVDAMLDSLVKGVPLEDIVS